MALSPMMMQYFEIKERHKDMVLFFRLGDFYEMFFEDAITVSRELELTLTGRDCGLEEKAPMCGVPHHSAENYIKRLIEKGYRIAIAEQMEEATPGTKIVSREVVRIITPGTVVENSMLNAGENNYIAAVYLAGKCMGIAFCDISTGELFATEKPIDAAGEEIRNELARFSPSEILCNEGVIGKAVVEEYVRSRMPIAIEIEPEESFAPAATGKIVLHQFENKSLAELGLLDKPLATSAVGALLAYVSQTQKNSVNRILAIEIYQDEGFMNVDETVRRNLELVQNLHTGEPRGSLLWVLDQTKTAMGKRLMKSTVMKPLINPVQINRRLDAVEELTQNHKMLSDTTEGLASIYDLQRLMTRVVYGNINPRELKSLSYTCQKIPALRLVLTPAKTAALRQLLEMMDPLTDVAECINLALAEDPPIALKEGGVIRPGFHQEVDELHEMMKNSRVFLAKIEQDEREKTGIKNLKIGYNKVFGYYLEVTNSYKGLAPGHYVRKQTLTGAERYITEELKVLEEKILGAHQRIVQVETALFEELRATVAGQLSRIQQTAAALAQLDVFASFARVATHQNYCRPGVDLSGVIDIKEGRHPVVEQMLPDEFFVPNATVLDKKNHQIMLITGPNMAGKSTYMRQVAIITLMAQIGSFVPASSARVGVVDRLFTRIGASDDLSTGRSTFMVEMSEVAHILKNATENSLIILDEIGRGTSTYDGMSIARAVVEHLATTKKIRAKTLFATHYHELTALAETFPGVENFNIAAKKRGDQITFMRRIVPGPADDSYGIEVSKLAGIPDGVVERAKEILAALEAGATANQLPQKTAVANKEKTPDFGEMQVLETLRRIDAETLSPLEALQALYGLKQMLTKS